MTTPSSSDSLTLRQPRHRRQQRQHRRMHSHFRRTGTTCACRVRTLLLLLLLQPTQPTLPTHFQLTQSTRNAPSSVTSALNRHLDFIANDLSSALSSRQGDKDNADDDNDSDDAPVKKSASSTTSKLNRLLSRKLDSDSDSDLKENDSAFKAAAPAAEVLDYSVSVSPTMKPNNVAPQHKDNQISVAKKRKNTDSKMGDAFKKTSRPMMAKERVAEIVEDDEDAGGRRKSRRVSVQPVEWWKGERVEYKMVLDKQTGVTVPQLDAQTLPKPIVSRRESMGKSVPRQHVVDDDSDSSNDEEKEEKEENSYKQENHPSTTSRRKSSSSTTTKNQSKSIKSRRASTASTSTTVSSKRPSKKKLSTNNLSDSSDNDADGNSYNNSNNNIVTINSHIQPPKSGPFTISAIDVATDTPTEQSLVYGPLDISPQPFGSFSLHRTFTIGDYCGVGFMDVPVGGEKGEKNAGSTSVVEYIFVPLLRCPFLL
ncbi:hypothetical protein BCR33DRAFT_219583 [Rhizoclosmatium globosum]|uniref:Uncharacterized protein n=1 Tax=Rhizoclosmatium globosum TaxID=329046 RepID=A0A1Y2CBP7_9FUNG|nr:hypothetical protein BCR33DRAFT_219583 [Rhizoclosmatium globosum]|eukprot:ORY44356.1 hypothetical protein BCR33DRAFT_219583 [Rhizoclosmatium globosum]